MAESNEGPGDDVVTVLDPVQTRKTLFNVRSHRPSAPCSMRASGLPDGCPGWCEFAQPDPRALSYGRPDAPLPLEPGELLPGPIRLVERVGSGGMGRVFRAWHERRHEAVAVKVLSPGLVTSPVARGRFLSESRALSRIDSPHVVGFRGFAVRRGVPYTVMSFISGETLAQRLYSGRLSLQAAISALRGVAQALIATHRASIVHNDVKSTNVMIDEREHVTLIDFGLARPIAPMCRIADDVSGTPRYMAPELVSGVAERPSAATDIYALGVLAFELVTGQTPFAADDPERLLEMQLHGQAPRVSDLTRGVPPELEALIEDCLVKDPSRRLPSAEAFSQRLSTLSSLAFAAVERPSQ